LSWLQQKSSGELPGLDEAQSSLAAVKETGPSIKQTAADTLGEISVVSTTYFLSPLSVYKYLDISLC